jgi:hypothetical protein
MSGERMPAERAEDELQSFREVIEGFEAEGEPLNIILSHRIREALEMYLKGVADAMARADGEAVIIGEMGISKGAEVLPHATKGQLREALTAYLTEQRYATEEEVIEELENNGDS